MAVRHVIGRTGVIVLGCDNCVPGDAGGWPWVLAGVAAVSIVIFAASAVRACRRGGPWSAVVICIGALGVAGSAVRSELPVPVANVSCGHPVAAARLELLRPGGEFDRYQAECRSGARRLLAWTGGVGLVSLVLVLIGALVGWWHRCEARTAVGSAGLEPATKR